MKLTHVCIVTGNLERLTQFYREVLEIEPEVHRGEHAEFPTGEGGATLALYSVESTGKPASGTMEAAPTRSVQLEFEVADLDREYERLRGLAIQWLMHALGAPVHLFPGPGRQLINFYCGLQ